MVVVSTLKINIFYLKGENSDIFSIKPPCLSPPLVVNMGYSSERSHNDVSFIALHLLKSI